ncbi:MAG: YceI family protein [Deltaproteobacteria bacterium]|nr:YceI family protein [Deltaproteobacteria bacterium]
MKLKILISVTTFLLLATTATALNLEGRCAIKFFGESTLSDFDGQAICQPFTLKTEEAAGKTGIIRQPVVNILVGKMDTDNSSRDKKMYAMFEQESYPEIQGLFADLDPDVILQQWQATETNPGSLGFNLRIREVSQRVEATISDLIVTPEQISFVMKFPLSLASFQLEPPSVFGMIRVDDKVRVEVRVFLRKSLD